LNGEREKTKEKKMAKQKQPVKRAAAAVQLTPTYVPFPGVFPSKAPSVTILFRGLLTFCFDGKKQCEVGIYNESQDPKPTLGQPHALDIEAWRKPGCVDDPGPLPPPKTSFAIHVDKPDTSVGVDGVYVFEQNPDQPFDRSSSSNDDKDFRWVLDFEGPDFYPPPLPPLKKNTALLKPSLLVDNGLFFTFYKTKSTFKKHPTTSGPDTSLNTIGDIVGANIYLSSGGSVHLTIDGVVTTLSPSAGTTYEVDVFNLCNASFPGCKFNPSSTKKERRNDFYIYYHTFDVPAGDQEHELININPVAASNIAMCGTPPDHLSDRAPCGLACFGRSVGL
jgi:hypothetical protein